ncbi:hypothetical protein RHSIM_Rhsim01G0059300 [Rhododendron simsii]|uniref:SWIM-type domain-containing protein n=1 Tax=Rhododendron simsii TaxID=118357 RepID=A0A834HJ15_RHOSS|nr:hypothetical protein RHSIM_Rhsim01G0059300 [Rhododendron simsii]
MLSASTQPHLLGFSVFDKFYHLLGFSVLDKFYCKTTINALKTLDRQEPSPGPRMGLGLASKAFYAMKDCCRKTVSNPGGTILHVLVAYSYRNFTSADIWMGKGKLILICQCGGEFVKNDDGSLKYAGGEAQAVNVNFETLFDDLKLKVAEVCNLEYKSVSIKYFLPGNTRTLISLANDKDLKRMLDFHGNSVTADVFVMGIEGFNRDALNIDTNRETVVKVAESVNHAVAPTAAATSSPADAASPVGTPPPPHVATGKTAARKKAARHGRRKTAARKKATRAADKGPTKQITARKSSAQANIDDSTVALHSPVFDTPRETSHRSTEIDMGATPADSVKKRRRTASWKIGVNGPTIVSVPDDEGDKSIKRPRKNKSQSLVVYEKKNEIVHGKDDRDPSYLANSDDVSPEKLVASWKGGITGVGQDFKDVSEFRDVLQKYAVAHRFAYRLKKNETTRASGRCVSKDCSWRIHASWVPAAESFRIKKFINSHSCGGESWKSAHPAKNWLVNIIKERLRDSPQHKPKEIANGLLRDFGIELNYTQVWRGIGDAREQLHGSYKESYNQLSWYCEKIVETNPGSFAELVIGDDKRFRSLFICFQASIHGFQKGCRPLIFVESTPLKSKHHEVLLTATALDGDDGFFPVAFAIVDVENDDHWLWFLEQLKSALPNMETITFVSDREKGLKEHLVKVFGNAYHGYSLYHLLESFKKNLKGPFHGDGRGSLPVNFVAAAHAIRLVGFKKFVEQIKQVSSHSYDWVMQIEPEYWTNALFKGERYIQVTQNVAELYIKVMEEARNSTITQKIGALVAMITELVNTRKEDSSNWCTKLTPSKHEKVQEEIAHALGLKVLFSSDTLFEVHDDVNHVVDLNKLECTCLGWKTTGLPCRHAIAVFNSTRRTVYDYCSKYFTVDSYRSTYSESINPVPCGKPAEEEEEEGTESDNVHVLPPCPSRSPNQPKTKEAKREGPAKRVVFCSRCKESGHNKASCKAGL